MDGYLFVNFLHVAAAILWLGGGFSIVLIAARAERANDDAQLSHVIRSSAFLGKMVFFPAQLILLISGGILWWMSWKLVEFWLLLGLGGFVASMLIGMLIMGPGSERLAARLDTEADSASALDEGRRLMRIGRFEMVILYSAAAVMVYRPQPSDIGLLAVLALAIIVGAVMFLMPGRRATPGTS